jgi:hypothetical protein
VTLRIASAIGAPFGLWAALWGLMVPQHTGGHLIAWAVVAATVVGAGAAATAMLFLRYTRGRWPSLLGLLVAQFGVALALAIGVLYGMTRWPAPGRWRPLPPAPEPVARLEGPDCVYDTRPAVAVRTTTGRLLWLTATASLLSWEPDEKRSADGTRSFRECSPRRGEESTQPAHPRPPSPPVQVHRVRLEGADCGGSAAYMLGQDGDLWEWEVYGCAIGVAAVVFGTGAVVFLLGVWAFALTVFSTEGRNWREAPGGRHPPRVRCGK